tara:strand:+ start:530 stop:763 length:234 start_codon:yes stop_codon:yes gene_type:complete
MAQLGLVVAEAAEAEPLVMRLVALVVLEEVVLVALQTLVVELREPLEQRTLVEAVEALVGTQPHIKQLLVALVALES